MALTRFSDTESLAKDVDDLAKRLEELRLAYEQYFLGLEREEPFRKRENVVALVRKYSGAPIQNARLKFKLQQSIAKYNTYCTYWDRTLREIEEGRHKRDVFRANLRKTSPTSQSTRKNIQATGAADSINDLFQKYVEAKKSCNESTKGLSLENFRKALNQQMAALQKKTKGTKIQFKVITKDGKATIKAIASKT